MPDWNICLTTALEQYIRESPWLAPRTIEYYTNHFRTLTRELAVLGESISLSKIDSRIVALYQLARSRQVSSCMVNKEVGSLRLVMRWAGLWTDNVKRYRVLPQDQPKEEEYIPSDEDIKRLVTVGVSKNRWEVALWASILSANTGFGPGEIRNLKVKDLHLGNDAMLDPGYVEVTRACKNVFRRRKQPLNPNAWFAISRLLARLTRLGYGEPEHFLIPHRIRSSALRSGQQRYDPTLPAGRRAYSRAFHSILKAAGLPHMRRYVMRHYFASALNRIPNLSDITKGRLMGHSGKSRLLERTYTHISQQEKSRAVAHLGVDVPGVLFHGPAPKAPSDGSDPSLAKLVRSVVIEAVEPFIEESQRLAVRRAAAVIQKSQDPDTPGAYLYPQINSAQMWARVDRTSHPEGCWIWRGPLQADHTQGCLWTGTRNGVARRVIYELMTDDSLPSDRVRLYPTCTTPLCVNPAHMVVGTRMPGARKAEGEPVRPVAREAAPRCRVVGRKRARFSIATGEAS